MDPELNTKRGKLQTGPRALLMIISLMIIGIAIGAVIWNSTGNTDKKPAIHTYKVEGVAVTKYSPATKSNKPPVIMVHGGAHGGWQWEKLATSLSDAGYECHVLNWYNHGDSDTMPENEFIKRSIVDVARQEIKYVADQFDKKPIVIGHSMGGLAALAYAERAPVEKLALLTPVMPAAVKPDPVPLQVDPTLPFPVFPYEQAKQLFFTTLSDDEAQRYYRLLVPESPQAVIEATQWTVAIDLQAIKTPTLVFATELDLLTPAVSVERLANMLHADYEYVPAIGHTDILLKEPQAHQTADKIRDWLEH